MKWVVVADLDQQFLLSQIARGLWNDCANLPAVVEAASESNHTYIRQQLGRRVCSPPSAERKPGVFMECVPKCGEHFRDASTGADP